MQKYAHLQLFSSILLKMEAKSAVSFFVSQTYATSTSAPLPAHQNYSCLVNSAPHVFSNPSLPNLFGSNFAGAKLAASAKSLQDRKMGFLWLTYGGRYSRPLNYGRHYSGWSSWLNRLTINEMVFGLIIANFSVFILWRIVDTNFMLNNFTISLNNLKHGRIHTLITSAFSHSDAEHIISNMIGLYFFGMNIGTTFGPKPLLKLYLAGAIGGSLLYLSHQVLMALSSKRRGPWAKDTSMTPGLGASGAVNAIMLLDIFLYPKAILYINFIVPVPAMLLGIFLIGKDMFRIMEGNSNVSGSAHLGGAAVAGIAWARVVKRGCF